MKFRSFLKMGLLAPLGFTAAVAANDQPKDTGYFILFNIITAEEYHNGPEGQSAKVTVKQIESRLKLAKDGGLSYEYDLPSGWSAPGYRDKKSMHYPPCMAEEILAEARACGRKRLATVTLRGPLVEDWSADSLATLLF